MMDKASSIAGRIRASFSFARTPRKLTARKDYWKGFVMAKREDGAITYEEYDELFKIIQKGEC